MTYKTRKRVVNRYREVVAQRLLLEKSSVGAAMSVDLYLNAPVHPVSPHHAPILCNRPHHTPILCNRPPHHEKELTDKLHCLEFCSQVPWHRRNPPTGRFENPWKPVANNPGRNATASLCDKGSRGTYDLRVATSLLLFAEARLAPATRDVAAPSHVTRRDLSPPSQPNKTAGKSMRSG
ncbi:hypothetical protein CC80DRAFT_499645 [Byssothecium circinans]|uniref:Uncharacterized protein n=1 Tax=Byssothecium circinans TaxID=147558 RepID=A0A6A5UBH5_9PLEO|nr:hypothetical protein CC80DRAFT_499645 [Byssothecium circinans]